MLFIAIILVFVLYMGLYLLWDSAGVSLAGTEPILRSLTHALTMPQHEVFMILRGVLLAALLYVIGDGLLTTARRSLRRRPKTEIFKATFTERSDQVYRN